MLPIVEDGESLGKMWDWWDFFREKGVLVIYFSFLHWGFCVGRVGRGSSILFSFVFFFFLFFFCLFDLEPKRGGIREKKEQKVFSEIWWG